MPSLPYSLEALILGRSRSITAADDEESAIIPDVTISEFHADEVTVTQHPVDTGADISDHAMVQPAIVTCSFGWSDSSRLINSALNGSILKGLETTKDVYQKLLKLMHDRALLSLSTGKRTYSNVLITRLVTTTTADTESALIIEATFQEVFLATAQTVSLAAATQKDPSKTAAVSQGGSKSAVPVEGAR